MPSKTPTYLSSNDKTTMSKISISSEKLLTSFNYIDKLFKSK